MQNQTFTFTPEQQAVFAQLAAMLSNAAAPSAATVNPTDTPPAVEPPAAAAPIPHPFPSANAAAEYMRSRREEFGVYQPEPQPRLKPQALKKPSGYRLIALVPLLIAALIVLGCVVYIAPAKAVVLAYGVGKAVLFAVAGTLIDVLLFPDSQCEGLEGIAQGTAWKRRALIIFGCLIIAAQLQ